MTVVTITEREAVKRQSMASPAARQPYGWVIEYSVRADGRPFTTFLLHDERNDEAAAIQRAADMRGVLIALIADRRKGPPRG